MVVVEDLVHQAVPAAAEAVHVHVVVVRHQAVHVAHVAEASLVEENPNQDHQRVAVAQNQSKFTD